MKKINLLMLLLCSTILFTGCTIWNNMSNDMMNTPTQKVEKYLMKYQKMDSEMIEDIKSFFFMDDITDENSDEYKKIIADNYKKLTYSIKEEEIDGKTATVKAEIEVITYIKTINDIENYINENEDEFITEEVVDDKLVDKYRLEKLSSNKDKETYMLEFELIKEDEEWVINNLGNDIEDKINGMYK